MSLRYAKVQSYPKTFIRLFGISVQEFDLILSQVRPEWESQIIGRYKRPGRDYKLDLADMILMLLLYYRCYTTQLFIGFLFGVDDSRVCRNIRMLEPLLAKVMAISKTRHLSQKDVEELILDATEQQIERPQKSQKVYYSGKKKRHTLKTEIRITPKGRIVHVSKTHPGSTHDLTLHKSEPPLPKETRAYVDSGYQGLDKIHTQTELPYKASKNKALDEEEKDYNQGLSRLRIKVENVFAQLKVFRILSHRYRNKRKRYNLKFNIIAGIVNLKNGFATV